MEIQKIIAFLIVISAAVYVLRKLYLLVFRRKAKTESNSFCNSCPSAINCQLKDLKTHIEKKEKGCEGIDVKEKKRTIL